MVYLFFLKVACIPDGKIMKSNKTFVNLARHVINLRLETDSLLQHERVKLDVREVPATTRRLHSCEQWRREVLKATRHNFFCNAIS